MTNIVFMSAPPKHTLVGRRAGTGIVTTGFPSDANALSAAPSQKAHQSNPSASIAIPSGYPAKARVSTNSSRLPMLPVSASYAIAEDRVPARVDEEHPFAVGRPVDAVGGEKPFVHRVALEVGVEAIEPADRSLLTVLERPRPDSTAGVDRAIVEAAAWPGLLRPGDELGAATREVKPVPTTPQRSDNPVGISSQEDAADVLARRCRAHLSGACLMTENLSLQDVNPVQGLVSIVPHRPLAQKAWAWVKDVDYIEVHVSNHVSWSDAVLSIFTHGCLPAAQHQSQAAGRELVDIAEAVTQSYLLIHPTPNEQQPPRPRKNVARVPVARARMFGRPRRRQGSAVRPARGGSPRSCRRRTPGGSA